MAATALLQTSGLTRSFGGLLALSDLTITVEAGGIQGLIGPNGSGKSTFINVVSGVLRPDAGRVTIAGRQIAGRRADIAARAGIARTFQNLRLFGGLTVLENVLMGGHLRLRTGLAAALLGTDRAREQGLREHAEQILALVRLTHRMRQPAGTLSYGEQRRLEIARALAARPRLLLLDEPLAGMNPAEMAMVVEIMQHTVAEGVTILLVEHAMRVVMAVCARITVLNFGRCIAAGPPAAIRRDEAVIRAYLGRARHDA